MQESVYGQEKENQDKESREPEQEFNSHQFEDIISTDFPECQLVLDLAMFSNLPVDKVWLAKRGYLE